jgi:hypothetical protein
MGILEDLLLWFKDYLFNRKQRVIINGKESSWKTVNAGVPQAKNIRNIQKLIPGRVIYCKTRLMFCD